MRKSAQKIKRTRNTPTKADLLAAAGRGVPDLIDYDLQVLFCGINPGLYSAWSGHHFARPGNRFWPALFASGLTKRLVAPNEEHELLRYGCGITNLVDRATLAAGELNRAELVAGSAQFCKKVAKYRPRAVAILGVSAFRLAFNSPDATVGPQRDKIADSLVWVLPNPSGLNAHFTPKTLAKLFRKFRLHYRALT